jgi:hypothetical protein
MLSAAPHPARNKGDQARRRQLETAQARRGEIEEKRKREPATRRKHGR